MQTRTASGPEWRHIDTVLFDLDGTLLDLSFDNRLWREFVPAAYAAAQRVTAQQLRFEQIELKGDIDFKVLKV